MHPIPPAGDRLLVERHAEYGALRALRPASFSDCLKQYGLETAIAVTTERGKALTVRGSDLYDKRTWNKFLAHRAGDAHQLAEAEMLAVQYKAWLLKEHTERYRSLASEAHLLWFERAISLAVVRHILAKKYELHARGLEAFADPWVAAQTGACLLYHDALRATARLIQHIVKEPAQAEHYIEQLAEKLGGAAQEMLQVGRQPLPPLPAGVTLQFALLPPVREGRDE